MSSLHVEEGGSESASCGSDPPKNQSCGSANIRIDFGQLNSDPGGQKLPTKIDKSKENSCFKCWMFFLGMKASPVAWTYFM